MNGPGLERLLRLASLHAPNVIVDLKEWWNVAYAQVLKQSNRIVIVTRLDFLAVSNANRALECVERLGIDRGRVVLVVNRSGQPKELSANDVASALRLRIAHSIPEDRKLINTCANCGISAVSTAPTSSYAQALECLAKELDVARERDAADASMNSGRDRTQPFWGRMRHLTAGIQTFAQKASM
jgi:Flp pilus assembly CpaE family ATPase